MKFNNGLSNYIRLGGFVRRAEWGNSSCLISSTDGRYYIKCSGSAFLYAFSFDDANADDWELCDG